ncbi:aminotransferase class V-fold PLP-dependent enzyme [Shewanella sp. NIFS-20-20]|uniref:aminotransferase class V-fold PLP-dependent enzyme n=1 Tax=Shewanella sp. NIFS-20-20 TaxID=2853806 RepID=UPI00210D582B|nr:cysteine desulfurase [Shewanella sp. NIFS-20-20]
MPTRLDSDFSWQSDLRSQFPLLNNQPICYLDTAATSQKPNNVIAVMDKYYRRQNANVHRAAHQLSACATTDFEAVRDKARALINANRREEIIFTSGTTMAANMLAFGLGARIRAGDVILLDSANHHANIVPWQQLAKRTGASLEVIPLDSACRLDIPAYQALLRQHAVKVVVLTHVSNVLGTVNPVDSLCQMAKAHGALTIVDGAQAIAHQTVDVSQMDCDFYLFSGHKMYGPTGVGVLYGRFSELDTLEPMMTGGEMIASVSFAASQFAELPHRLEAGTPAIAEVIGLGGAIDFMQALPSNWQQCERTLLHMLQSGLSALPAITVYGAHSDNVAVVAFNIKGEHHQDVGMLLDQMQIAIRCGHHCAQPLIHSLGLQGCCRVSLGIYTTEADIQQFLDAMAHVVEMLG